MLSPSLNRIKECSSSLKLIVANETTSKSQFILFETLMFVYNIAVRF